jgi:hypothetical protein
LVEKIGQFKSLFERDPEMHAAGEWVKPDGNVIPAGGYRLEIDASGYRIPKKQEDPIVVAPTEKSVIGLF